MPVPAIDFVEAAFEKNTKLYMRVLRAVTKMGPNERYCLWAFLAALSNRDEREPGWYLNHALRERGY